MAKSERRRPMDPVRANLQETEVPVGSAGRTPRYDVTGMIYSPIWCSRPAPEQGVAAEVPPNGASAGVMASL